MCANTILKILHRSLSDTFGLRFTLWARIRTRSQVIRYMFLLVALEGDFSVGTRFPQVEKKLPHQPIDFTSLESHHVDKHHIRSLFPPNRHWHALSAWRISQDTVIKTDGLYSSINVHFLSEMRPTLRSSRNALRTPTPEKSSA